MKAFVTVARRELQERRFLLLVGAVCGFIPLVIALFQTGAHQSLGVLRFQLALKLQTLLTLLISILLGTSVFGANLGGKPLAFYFTRPISATAIWAGKTAGSLITIVGTTSLFLLPAFALGGESLRAWPQRVPIPALLWGQTCAAMFFLALAHYFVAAVKSRSAWLFAGDLVLLFTLLLLSFALSARLRVPYSWEALGPALQILAGAIFLGSVASSFASVAFGRVDISSARKAQWVTLWGIVLPAVLLFAAYAERTSTGRLNLATVDDVIPSPAGNWLAIRGQLSERADSSVVFLWNPSKNDFVSPGSSSRASDPVFSRDGIRSAWFVWRGPLHEYLESTELSSPDHRTISFQTPQQGELPKSFEAESLVFSPLGKTLAVARRGTLSAYRYEGSSMTPLGSAEISAWRPEDRLLFISEDRVRIYKHRNSVVGGPIDILEILEFELPAQKLETMGRIEGLKSPFRIVANLSGDRLVIAETGGAQTAIYDGETGIRLKTLSLGGARDSHSVCFLSSGQIIIGEGAGGTARLHCYSAQGEPLWSTDLGAGGRVVLGGQPDLGRLLVFVSSQSAIVPKKMRGKVFVINLATAKARWVASDLYPIVASGRAHFIDPTVFFVPGSDATKLFQGADGSLVHFDPLTGERRVILGKH